MIALPTASEGERRWLGLPIRTLISLAWALPFLAFLAFPIASALDMGLDHPIARAFFIEVIALGFVYSASWVVNESGPANDSGKWVFLAFIFVILALQIAMFITATNAGGGGGVYILSYVLSPIALQAPKRWVAPGIALVVALGALELLFSPVLNFFPIISVTITTLVCVFARLMIDHDRTKEVAMVQNLALSRERERTRISADLHDILGQTLTGITVKADLAGRLLDGGRIDEARAQIDDLTEMSRTALADVRDVVAANRTLLPETEIESARAILDAAGIRLNVVHEGDPAPGTPSSLVAHVIREGCINAFRHSDAKTVTITVREDSVTVTNDGVKRQALRPGDPLHRSSDQLGRADGSGLEGLRDRVGSRGSLLWGREADLWTLELRFGGVE